MRISLDEAERCLLRPRRSHLAEAVAVAAPYATACRVCVGHPKPPPSCWACLGSGRYLDDETRAADAWRALADGGVIPSGWWGDPRRSFVTKPRAIAQVPDEAPRRWVGGPTSPSPEQVWETQSSPRTVRACIALASDPEGVAAAEAAALRDANEGMFFGPVAPPRVDRVMWRFVPDTESYRRTWIERWRRDEAYARGFGGANAEVLARGYRIESLPQETVVMAVAELRM